MNGSVRTHSRRIDADGDKETLAVAIPATLGSVGEKAPAAPAPAVDFCVLVSPRVVGETPVNHCVNRIPKLLRSASRNAVMTEGASHLHMSDIFECIPAWLTSGASYLASCETCDDGSKS